YEVAEVGYNQLRQVEADELGPGEVGYVVANVRTVKETRAGDTLIDAALPETPALPGYKDVHSMVFSGLYPTDTTQYETLRDALDRIEEPYVKARIMAPAEYIGPIMTLGTERRGVYKNMTYLDTSRVEFDWEFPLGEIILDFFDKLKTISRGYASLDYDMLEYRESDLVKLDMLINGEAIDAFSVIIHRDKSYEWGRKIADKLKELIPRQLFEVAIQAAIGNKILARTSVKALRKDVLAKCY